MPQEGGSSLTHPVSITALCLHTKLLQLCPALCDPMDSSPPGSSVRAILQARILKWVAMPPPRELPDPGIEPASLPSSAPTSPQDSPAAATASRDPLPALGSELSHFDLLSIHLETQSRQQWSRLLPAWPVASASFLLALPTAWAAPPQFCQGLIMRSRPKHSSWSVGKQMRSWNY